MPPNFTCECNLRPARGLVCTNAVLTGFEIKRGYSRVRGRGAAQYTSHTFLFRSENEKVAQVHSNKQGEKAFRHLLDVTESFLYKAFCLPLDYFAVRGD